MSDVLHGLIQYAKLTAENQPLRIRDHWRGFLVVKPVPRRQDEWIATFHRQEDAEDYLLSKLDQVSDGAS